ncbi:hypothetical protein F511_45575 [Dorcoceras hygrometricum]|uniref:Dehydrin 13 n=1 Tax=Dorcoceras hygrometricum TaxID=472368 RepID=A0A2Z6ZWU1_9LAMI|nr:hypothetical protein F511_45575 [Dorcoceras hygrometricum]
MDGIMQKIEERFKGRKKEGEKHEEYKGAGHSQVVKPEHKTEHGYGEHRPGQNEGFVNKIKGKIHGEGGKDKKKKKERKVKGHGHDHGHSSSSSDSD